ncbi:O-antigen ligase family protein [Nannocystaceae bacterium ST9]
MPSGSTSSARIRESLSGLALAIYLLVGRWSPSRTFALEPSPLLEPRVWAVALLVGLALAPRTRDPGPASPELPAWWSASLLAQLGLWAWTASAATWSPAGELALGLELLDVALMVAVTLALHRLVLVSDPLALVESLERGLIGLLVALALLALAGGLAASRMAALGGGPNVFGRNMGLLCVLALHRAMAVPRARDMVLALLAAGLVALSGSRGAMAATALAGAALISFGRARPSRRVLVLSAALIGALLVLGTTEIGQVVIDRIRVRVIDLLLGRGYVSNRDRIYVVAIELGLSAPIFGQGLGSFAVATPWPYAHDLVLDAWAETGLIGVLLLLVALAVLGLGLLTQRWRRVDGLAAAALLMGVASLFSGGRYDARGLWCLATLALLVPLRVPRRPSMRRPP